jgi:YfiH family protein
LLFDPTQKAIGAVHAGWRGTQSEILYHTILKMQKLYGSKPSEILAYIAPSIGACCYEVGFDVAKHFLATPNALTQQGEKYMLNLPYLNALQLQKVGLKSEHIEHSKICTACEVERYFSYRQEKGCSGRFASLIGLHF